MRKMQGLMMEGGGRREWVVDRRKKQRGEEDEGEDVRIFRRDRWVVERKEGGKSWFMDLKAEEKVEEGEEKVEREGEE